MIHYLYTLHNSVLLKTSSVFLPFQLLPPLKYAEEFHVSKCFLLWCCTWMISKTWCRGCSSTAGGCRCQASPRGLIRRAGIHRHTRSPTGWPLSTTDAGNYSENIPFVSTAVTLRLEGCWFRTEWVGELGHSWGKTNGLVIHTPEALAQLLGPRREASGG